MSHTTQPKPEGFPVRTRMAHTGFILYLVSCALPAVIIAGDPLMGFQAAILSFIGFPAILDPEFLERGQGPACFFGALANSLLLIAYLAFVIKRHLLKRVSSYRVISVVAAFGAIAACGSGLFLAFGSERFIPLPGFFLWPPSMALLAFACWGSANDGTAEIVAK